ncbi:MAG TPA: hypothetical protein VH643_25285 [Gemmataceae bacterium]|jgi:hypothetical protein
MTSWISLGLAAAFSLLQGAETLANAPSFTQQSANPRLCFVNLADYPDYDFYLQYHAVESGNPLDGPLLVMRLSSGAPIALDGKGRRFSRLLLVAVPAGQPAPPNDLRNIDAAEWGKTPNPWPSFVPAWFDGTTLQSDSADLPAITYRVTIQEDDPQRVLYMEELRRKTDRRTPTLLAGAALSLALAGAGVWFIRRRRTRMVRMNRTSAVSPP